MTATVRTRRSWRYMLRFLTALYAAAAGLIWLLGAPVLGFGGGAVLFLLMIVPAALMLLHFECRSVTFSPKGIQWKRHFYPWSQVEQVWEFHSATELRTICIRFRDGKTLRFRMEEENADQARRLIARHRSIEI